MNITYDDYSNITSLVPIMTSNTTPSPFVISAGSVFRDCEPYKAFIEEKGIDDCWHNNGDSNKHIDIFLGGSSLLKKVAITLRNDPDFYYPIRGLDIKGSNNGEEWHTIRSISNIESWKYNETREFDLENYNSFEHYRIQVTSHSGSYVAIGKIKLYGRMLNIKYSSSNYAYQNTTLPMNSIDKILSKTSDQREGLLGMANNDENYGELYVVGKDGKSHLTRNGIKKEYIWSGSVSTGNISVSKNLSKFTYVLFETHSGTNYDKLSTCSVSITKDIIDLGKFSINEFNDRHSVISFNLEDNDLYISSKDLTIVNIVGFY